MELVAVSYFWYLQGIEPLRKSGVEMQVKKGGTRTPGEIYIRVLRIFSTASTDDIHLFIEEEIGDYFFRLFTFAHLH